MLMVLRAHGVVDHVGRGNSYEKYTCVAWILGMPCVAMSPSM